MIANVRPKGKIRNRDGTIIREGGVNLDRHSRWLLKNGSLENVEAVQPEEAKPATRSRQTPKPVEEEVKADG